MPYIGKDIPTAYQSTKAVQRFNGNGSGTTFTLTTSVSSVQDVLVSVDGVVQDTAAYTIPDGTTLTFTTAPSSGTGNIFVNYLAPQQSTITPAAENKGNFKAGGLIRTNAQTLLNSVTINATENAVMVGDVEVNSGVTLTIENGGRLVIV